MTVVEAMVEYLSKEGNYSDAVLKMYLKYTAAVLHARGQRSVYEAPGVMLGIDEICEELESAIWRVLAELEEDNYDDSTGFR